jgi:transcriptional regulator with XRE-family HTH domain
MHSGELHVGITFHMARVSVSKEASRLESAAEGERERFGALLKQFRLRLNAELRSLGPFLRLPIRVGKMPTQEEIAEAVGISRVWYAMLESNRRVRVSAQVLARISDALMLSSSERDELFSLALPELRSAALTDRSTALLAAFGWLRPVTRRLWAATTEAEALTIVREYAMAQLSPDLMITRTRVGAGHWAYAGTGDSHSGERVEQLDELLRNRLGQTAVDESLCYPVMGQPGELLTRYERAAVTDGGELDAVGWSDVSFAIACVRSQGGFVARLLALHHTAHPFSELERAELSVLADLASLALSGRA